jgi:hypothetical protein
MGGGERSRVDTIRDIVLEYLTTIYRWTKISERWNRILCERDIQFCTYFGKIGEQMEINHWYELRNLTSRLEPATVACGEKAMHHK